MYAKIWGTHHQLLAQFSWCLLLKRKTDKDTLAKVPCTSKYLSLCISVWERPDYWNPTFSCVTEWTRNEFNDLLIKMIHSSIHRELWLNQSKTPHVHFESLRPSPSSLWSLVSCAFCVILHLDSCVSGSQDLPNLCDATTGQIASASSTNKQVSSFNTQHHQEAATKNCDSGARSSPPHASASSVS